MKIFRRFRESLIPAKGFRKYILYALGEIILVVVGILIALGINQASEENSKRKEMHRTAQLVYSQMTEDQKNIENVLREMDYMEKMIDTVLYLTPLDQPIDKDCNTCFNVLMGSSLPNTSVRVPNLIRQNPLVEGALENELHNIELIYNDELQMEVLYDRVTYDQITENINYWKTNFDWFAAYMSRRDCNDDCLDYFQNSADYRNRVAYFEFTIVEGYYYELEIFRRKIEREIEVLWCLL